MRLDDGRVVPAFIGQALRGEDFTVFGDGAPDPLLLLRRRPGRGHPRLLPRATTRPGEPGNPASSRCSSSCEVVRELAGGGGKIIFQPLPQDDPKQRSPTSRAPGEVLGWEPRVRWRRAGGADPRRSARLRARRSVRFARAPRSLRAAQREACMKIVVTGGAGFIGSHVATRSCATGHEVLVLDDLSSGRKENLDPPGAAVHARHPLRRGRELIAPREPDGPRPPGRADGRAPLGRRPPLRRRRQHRSASSTCSRPAAKAGAQAGALRLDRRRHLRRAGRLPRRPRAHPTRPLSPYGVSKAGGRALPRLLPRRSTGCRYAALRYANVYGPRQNPHGEAGVVAIFCERLLAGRGVHHLRRRRSRRATSSTWATWRGPTCSRSRATTSAPSTSAPASRPT